MRSFVIRSALCVLVLLASLLGLWAAPPAQAQDTDGDGVADAEDPCPVFFNATWIDTGLQRPETGRMS